MSENAQSIILIIILVLVAISLAVQLFGYARRP